MVHIERTLKTKVGSIVILRAQEINNRFPYDHATVMADLELPDSFILGNRLVSGELQAYEFDRSFFIDLMKVVYSNGRANHGRNLVN